MTEIAIADWRAEVVAMTTRADAYERIIRTFERAVKVAAEKTE